MTTWAKRIKDLRGSGYTLQEIADEIGLTKSSVCDIEQGRTKEPTGGAAIKLYEMKPRRRKSQRE